MNVTLLKSIIPEIVVDSFIQIPNIFHINTELRVAHFFAQTMHESANFKIMVENLNYSAKRLLQIFPKYFKDVAPESYAHQPQKIASRVYANRMGNGNELSEDGWKYRGRGFIQLTGKNNYMAFGKSIGEPIETTPDVVETQKYALISAAWFWSSHGCNSLADTGSDKNAVEKVTKRINGGIIGLDERYNNFVKIYNLIKT